MDLTSTFCFMWHHNYFPGILVSWDLQDCSFTHLCNLFNHHAFLLSFVLILFRFHCLLIFGFSMFNFEFSLLCFCFSLLYFSIVLSSLNCAWNIAETLSSFHLTVQPHVFKLHNVNHNISYHLLYFPKHCCNLVYLLQQHYNPSNCDTIMPLLIHPWQV